MTINTINDGKTYVRVDDSCTGCMACAYACPHGCIYENSNDEGFSYPGIKKENCINCGACQEMCDSCKNQPTGVIRASYIALGRHHADSTSGGIFYELAKAFVYEKGYVAGCVMDDDYKVKHILTNVLDDIERMRGSKYVQSDILGILGDLKYMVDNGEKVLFVGTPCQCAAVLALVGGKPENLYLVDLICSGISSPIVWEKHINRICSKNNIIPKKISFREKDKFEKTRYSLILDDENQKVIIPGYKDPYYCQYIKGNSFRESCYLCTYSNDRRVGDITIGDCASWKSYLDFYPQFATSTVFINSQKGEKIWNDCLKNDSIEFMPMDALKEISLNHALNRPPSRNALRDEFYSDFFAMSERVFEKKYTLKTRLDIKLLKSLIKRIITAEKRERLRKEIMKVLKIK